MGRKSKQKGREYRIGRAVKNMIGSAVAQERKNNGKWKPQEQDFAAAERIARFLIKE